MPTPTLQQVADAVIRRAQRQGYVVPSEVRSELRLAGLEETLWKDAVELGRASLIYKQGRYYHKAAVSPRLEQEQRQRQAIDKALRPLIRQYRRRAREQERRTQARIDYVQTVQIQPEDGAAFTLLCLITGSLWGRPEWGTYWVWDARLTSELVLFLLYLGVIAVWRTVEDPSRAARAAAILTLVGAIDLPIIKFSVDWWNTLHQSASVFRMGGPTIYPTILIPLLVMTLAFTLLFATLHLAAMRNEILRRRVRTLRLMQASAVS